jgi:spermidine/putrescine-binding protein
MTQLTVLTWPDYAVTELEDMLREATGVDVEWAFFDQNEEAYARVSAAPDRYDVIFADGAWPRRFWDAGLVRALGAAELRGWADVHPVFAERCHEAWGIGDGRIAARPGYWGVRGLIFDPDRIAAPRSWDALWDAPEGGAWVNSQGSEVIAETALALGFPAEAVYELEGGDLERVTARLRELGSKLGGAWRLLPDLIAAFAGGAVVAEVHSTTLATNVAEAIGRPVEAAVPREGTVAWLDGAMIGARSRQPEVALAFLEIAFSERGVLGQWEQSDGYWSVNRTAMAALAADPRFASRIGSAEAAIDVLSRSVQYRPPGDARAYALAWQQALGGARNVPASVTEATAWLAAGSPSGGIA